MLREFEIKRAKAKEKPYRMSDGDGLFLLVKPNGSKLWQQRYRFHDKEKIISHGQYPVVGIKEARDKSFEARRLLAEGTDPQVQKRLDKLTEHYAANSSFLNVALEYLEECRSRDLAPSTMRKKDWHVHELAKPIHARPIGAITSAELLQLLKNIEQSGRRETAKKLKSTLSAIFRIAVLTNRADGDPTAALRGALLPPKVTPRAAITDEKQFGVLLQALDDYTGWRPIADAMKFQILTMTRPGEVRGAKKQEFDLEKRVWTIPAERMKMRREHKIPLSRQAIAIVEHNWSGLDAVRLIFPSLLSNRKWLSENAFNTALRRMGFAKDEVSSHGFRATASTFLNERGYNPDVIEAALAHQDTNAIRRAYNRSTYWEQRIEMMQVWSDLCDEYRCQF